MSNKVLLVIGFVLVMFGVFCPNISLDNNVCPTVINYVIDAPSDTALLNQAQNVIKILQSSDDSTRPSDCLRLSSLYADMATLIELDNDDMIIKDTITIKEANSLSGKMLKLNIKDKYPDLAEASRAVVITAIGDDDILLDENSRNKAVEAFRALSWAFYEGSK